MKSTQPGGSVLLPILLPNTERSVDSHQLRVFWPATQVPCISQVVADLSVLSHFSVDGGWCMHHLKGNGGDDEVDVPTLLSWLHLTLQPPQPWVKGVPRIFTALNKNKYIKFHLVPDALTLDPCSLASLTMFCTPSTVLGKKVLTVTLVSRVVPQLSKVSSMYRISMLPSIGSLVS